MSAYVSGSWPTHVLSIDYDAAYREATQPSIGRYNQYPARRLSVLFRGGDAGQIDTNVTCQIVAVAAPWLSTPCNLQRNWGVPTMTGDFSPTTYYPPLDLRSGSVTAPHVFRRDRLTYPDSGAFGSVPTPGNHWGAAMLDSTVAASGRISVLSVSADSVEADRFPGLFFRSGFDGYAAYHLATGPLAELLADGSRSWFGPGTDRQHLSNWRVHGLHVTILPHITSADRLVVHLVETATLQKGGAAVVIRKREGRTTSTTPATAKHAAAVATARSDVYYFQRGGACHFMEVPPGEHHSLRLGPDWVPFCKHPAVQAMVGSGAPGASLIDAWLMYGTLVEHYTLQRDGVGRTFLDEHHPNRAPTDALDASLVPVTSAAATVCRSVVGTGLHRELTFDVSVSMQLPPPPPSPSLEGSTSQGTAESAYATAPAACVLALVMQLESTTYIDLDEAREHSRHGGAAPWTSYTRFIDVEKPAGASRQHVVLLSLPLSEEEASSDPCGDRESQQCPIPSPSPPPTPAGVGGGGLDVAIVRRSADLDGSSTLSVHALLRQTLHMRYQSPGCSHGSDFFGTHEAGGTRFSSWDSDDAAYYFEAPNFLQRVISLTSELHGYGSAPFVSGCYAPVHLPQPRVFLSCSPHGVQDNASSTPALAALQRAVGGRRDEGRVHDKNTEDEDAMMREGGGSGAQHAKQSPADAAFPSPQHERRSSSSHWIEIPVVNPSHPHAPGYSVACTPALAPVPVGDARHATLVRVGTTAVALLCSLCIIATTALTHAPGAGLRVVATLRVLETRATRYVFTLTQGVVSVGEAGGSAVSPLGQTDGVGGGKATARANGVTNGVRSPRSRRSGSGASGRGGSPSSQRSRSRSSSSSKDGRQSHT